MRIGKFVRQFDLLGMVSKNNTIVILWISTAKFHSTWIDLSNDTIFSTIGQTVH